MSIQQPLHATPPESFSSVPLTPPPTDEKTTRLVLRIIEEIKRRKDGYSSPIRPWTGYTLHATEYKDLQQLFRSDESLWGFVRHKLRYKVAHSLAKYIVS
jgi:hypothetical protein